MHKNDPTLPPLAVLDALRRPRRPYLPMEPETGQARPTPLQRALATAEVFPTGQHMPPPCVLGALYWRRVRRITFRTKRHYSPLGLHLAAQRAREERPRRVLVRRGQLVYALFPDELGPDDEVLADSDPYFRKKGPSRTVVEAWRRTA
jgi:hypothetical protein